MPKVLTIGEVIAEIYATTLGDGFLVPQPLIGPFPAGAPAIFIDQVAKLGVPAAIVSRVGDDDFGHLNLARFAKDGVETSGIEVVQALPTGSAFVRYQADGSRKFVFNIARSACGELAMTPKIAELIESCTHLHIMGSSLSSESVLKLTMEAVEMLKGAGGTVSFDPNLRPELPLGEDKRQALQTILDLTDVFLPSGNEIFLFTHATTEAAAIDELLARGVHAIVHKKGRDGASYYSAQRRLQAPALHAEEIDPTGEGDAFGGAFIAGVLLQEPLETTLEMACAAGARAVSYRGAMQGTSTRAELQAFIKAQAS